MKRMSAFEIWLRRGRIVAEPGKVETKFNPGTIPTTVGSPSPGRGIILAAGRHDPVRAAATAPPARMPQLGVWTATRHASQADPRRNRRAPDQLHRHEPQSPCRGPLARRWCGPSGGRRASPQARIHPRRQFEQPCPEAESPLHPISQQRTLVERAGSLPPPLDRRVLLPFNTIRSIAAFKPRSSAPPRCIAATAL